MPSPKRGSGRLRDDSSATPSGADGAARHAHSGSKSSNSQSSSSKSSSSKSSSSKSSAGNATPRRHPRPEVDARIRQLDAERDPLSLPEEIVSEASRSGRPVGIPTKMEDAQPLNIADMQRTPIGDLHNLAAAEGLTEYAGLTRQELVFQILKQRMKINGLMYGEGTLEILPDGFGFLRSPEYHYMSCPDDIYVSPSQIRRFGLKTGSHVAGQIRPPKENERYFALLRIEAINRDSPTGNKVAVPFDELTPVHPSERLRLEFADGPVSMRIIDLITPIGMGTRGLIVSPPRAGKTMLVQSIATAVMRNHPSAYVFVLLIDERPEEVTHVLRDIDGDKCEVISSTFDEAPSRHVQVAQMVIEKARRMVESGTDVVILMDSITRLARAHQAEASMGKTPPPGTVDAAAMQRPKELFGSARKVEQGGSLTIIATAEVNTGSDIDNAIYESFRGTGNAEMVLCDDLVRRRTFPAIDVFKSGTRREEVIVGEDDFNSISNLRGQLADDQPAAAMQRLIAWLGETNTNRELLERFRNA